MSGFKSWLFSGGWYFLVAGLWLFTWLLGPTNGNGSSVWMLAIAMMFLILGLTQSGQENRRRRG